MPASDIIIKGAREHNLRSVDVVLPRNKLICLTGVSGSGKSSLAFDTLYAEGQRRYVESLSNYARQFLGQMPKPDVDYIGGLRPSISISQKAAGTNPRSTVGTITEIYDYLRVLFARVGDGHCPQCDRPITAQTREQIIQKVLRLDPGSRISVLAPLVRGQKGEFRDLFEDLLKRGFVRARVDGQIVRLTDDLHLDRQMRHDIEVVVDRLAISATVRPRVAEAVELALKVGRGNLIVALAQDPEPAATKPASRGTGRARAAPHAAGRDMMLSADYACTHCGVSFEPPSPQLFSFNSPQGMCLECDGLGEAYTFAPELLVPDPRLSFRRGALELVGPWNNMGRWRRHVYQGVAETMERVLGLDAGTLLETPWSQLEPQLQDIWLWGTKDQHITFTWRGGSAPIKYGGTFDGIIPDLRSKYRSSKNRMQIAKLEKYMRTVPCPVCHGERLNAQARSVRVTSRQGTFQASPSRTLPDVCRMTVADAVEFFQELELDPTRRQIAEEVLKEIRGRLRFLLNVGLDYLTLDRTAPTLSGGESQRIRLAGQIGCGLVGVLYILDEPSIGLHARDNHRLLDTLAQLRDMGNTVVVVEHDEETMRASDHIIDFGPGPGVRGGQVVAQGRADQIRRTPQSVTGQYLSGKQKIEIPQTRRCDGDQGLTIVGAAHNNLKQIDVVIPLGRFVCVTGVSGSGKSSLVNDILVQALRRDLNRGEGQPGAHERIEGLEHLDKLIAIDQSPIGRTPRSNPATYIKVLDDIRKLYAQLPESRRRGYKPGRFSFNVEGGRCGSCDGNGSNRLEMDFLADVWITCPVCDGHRFNRETLGVTFKGKSISDVLEMDVQQALDLFENVPNVRHKLQTLHDVGLDYLKLGQPSPTLSGGEAQRIKLARELVKKSTGQTLYLLDEPTTGLHFADIQMLLKVLHNFVDAGNTVLVVEHNLDVVKTADWIIDLGPEGGDAGGRVVATGTPEEIARNRRSYTGHALRPILGGGTASSPRGKTNGEARRSRRRSPAARLTRKIDVRGARQHNLKDVNVAIDRDRLTVLCGPSGSGKSSLAMDTIYAEGQRRYVESLSAYARQFVSQMQKPHLDKVEGLSPAIAIQQQNLGNTPRSTVGTVTEIYDYLRILFARAGTPYCPDCDKAIGTQSADEVIDKIMTEPQGAKLYLMAPVGVEVGEEYETLWDELRQRGFVRIRVDGQTHSIDRPPQIDRRRKHRVEVVVDRVTVRSGGRARIADSVEAALDMGRGVMHVARVLDDRPETRWPTTVHSQHLACDQCGRSFDPLTPHSFSFNSYLGWCPQCEGLGTQTGANPTALVRNGRLTLAEGALLLWPHLDKQLSRLMLEALAHGTGLPLDVPFDQLGARHRRMILHGTGDLWLEVFSPGRKKSKRKTPPLFRFQFKGLYPALEEAARLSPSLRGKLQHLVDEVECSSCGGSRLHDEAAAVRYRGLTLDEICRQPLGQLQQTVQDWRLTARQRKIVGELVREIRSRLQFLTEVGLDYLTLSRSAASLSGGEAQRIRLASQLGSGLCGVLYVLDEPTIGLHPRDNRRLLGALRKLRDLGNTLVVVEHDRDVIANSDAILDFGPGAGKHGGQIVARGAPAQVQRRRASVTGPYLSGKKAIAVPANRRRADAGDLVILGARHNNLRNIDVRIPLGTLTAITGVSGSGKSSLINDVLYASLARTLHRANAVPGAHDAIEGIEMINKVIRVDQQPLGNSPSSNPATYTGVFELIRELFARLPESRLRGYTPRRFSFNVPGGRCEACEGNGQKCIEMHFLPDVWVTCDTCQGRRYNPETLAVTFRGRSIADVLEMTCGEAVSLMANLPKIRRILQTLCDVGLDYLTLGQPAPTLSGGEAQRVKLAAELSRPDTGQTLYLLDEPTTGLHFDDLAKLLEVLHRLVDLGNTVAVIEHNLDVIKSADWVVDMGPEAGDQGGLVVAEGTPEQLVRYAEAARKATATNGRARGTVGNGRNPPRKARDANGTTRDREKRKTPPPRSYTGEALKPLLAAGPCVERPRFDAEAANGHHEGDVELNEIGREVRMPWQLDGRRWHCEDRVDRKGQPCRWDGRILAEVVDRIHELGTFSDTNWDARSVVEISGLKKSDGWFFHAITGEAWLLKLKFRVLRNTFKQDVLHRAIPLKPLNQMDDLPVYGNDPRVKCKNLRGPLQEVELRVHSFEEIDIPAFWGLLKDAVDGFRRFAERASVKPEDIMPWKKLGEKWHFSRRGFPPGKRVHWQPEILDQLFELLRETASDGQFLWNNQQVVHLFVPGKKDPWASIWTKRPDNLRLILNGPKGTVSLGRVAQLGRDRSVETSDDQRDVVRLLFRKSADLDRGDLRGFLREHVASVKNE